jgi:hypothetical protein
VVGGRRWALGGLKRLVDGGFSFWGRRRVCGVCNAGRKRMVDARLHCFLFHWGEKNGLRGSGPQRASRASFAAEKMAKPMLTFCSMFLH